MRTQAATGGAAFGLLFVSYIGRVIEEGTAVARDPFLVLAMLTAAALAHCTRRTLRLLPRL